MHLSCEYATYGISVKARHHSELDWTIKGKM